jgi:hypothetical protein
MASNIDYRGLSARQDPRNLINVFKKTVNFNDPGLAAGVLIGPDALPQGAFIIDVWVEVVVAFNAGTTNTFSIGTNSPNFNNISNTLTGQGSSSIGTQVTEQTVGYGRSLAAAGDTQIFVKYAFTGTPPTTGQAVICIAFEGGFST